MEKDAVDKYLLEQLYQHLESFFVLTYRDEALGHTDNSFQVNVVAAKHTYVYQV